MTTDALEREKARIDSMDQEEMARLWRFAPAGHPSFVNGSALHEHINKRNKGFNPTLTKKIGLEPPCD